MVLIPIAIALAFEFVASLLNRPKQQWYPSTPLTQRGSYLPFVIGSRRVSPVFAWAGNRRFHSSGGGKGSSHGGTATYYESGWHQICVGPATRLDAIVQSGADYIFHTTITPTSSPSGTSHNCTDGSTFTIYWGEPTQPVNAFLGDSSRVAVNSRWPRICYVVWNQKKLGGSPYWPDLKYDITCEVASASPLTSSSYYMPETVAGYGDDGVNPAHALWQILTAAYPNGAGIPASSIDAGTVEALGALLATEHTPCNLLCETGTEAQTKVGELMSDYGFAMPQIQDLLAVIPIRTASSVVTLPSDAVSAPLVETTRSLGEFFPDRRIYIYDDRPQNWARFDIPMDNDAHAAARNNSKSTSIQMPNCISWYVAQRIINRREMEFVQQTESYRFSVMRGARNVSPGQVFVVPNVGQVRVSTVKLATDSTKTEIEALTDQFADPTTVVISQGAGYSGFTPAADTNVLVFQMPASITSLKAIGVMRIRANNLIDGSDIYVSDDNVTYSVAGSQDQYSTGGTLNAAITAGAGSGTPVTIATGPSITAFNNDILEVLDLTAQTTRWNAGDQICIIDSEVFFLESISAVVGGWQLNGMIRAQFGSTAANHAIGAKVYIAQKSQLSILAASVIRSGATVYVKSDPHIGGAAVDISTVTAVSLSIT